MNVFMFKLFVYNINPVFAGNDLANLVLLTKKRFALFIYREISLFSRFFFIKALLNFPETLIELNCEHRITETYFYTWPD